MLSIVCCKKKFQYEINIIKIQKKKSTYNDVKDVSP